MIQLTGNGKIIHKDGVFYAANFGYSEDLSDSKIYEILYKINMQAVDKIYEYDSKREHKKKIKQIRNKVERWRNTPFKLNIINPYANVDLYKNDRYDTIVIGNRDDFNLDINEDNLKHGYDCKIHSKGVVIHIDNRLYSGMAEQIKESIADGEIAMVFSEHRLFGAAEGLLLLQLANCYMPRFSIK